MPNNTVLAATTGLPKKTQSAAALVALWHQSEAVLKRGSYPDHIMNLMVGSQDILMRKIIGTPCLTEQDLAAKLRFAAFVVESSWRGEKVEADIIGKIASDYERLCRESQKPQAA
jgi:hypothetical protein